MLYYSSPVFQKQGYESLLILVVKYPLFAKETVPPPPTFPPHFSLFSASILMMERTKPPISLIPPHFFTRLLTLSCRVPCPTFRFPQRVLSLISPQIFLGTFSEFPFFLLFGVESDPVPREDLSPLSLPILNFFFSRFIYDGRYRLFRGFPMLPRWSAREP